MSIKSILAILAGMVAVAALSIGTDQVLVWAKYFPPLEQFNSFSTEMLIVATIYRSLYAVLGGTLAARLAPSAPMTHALILGAIGTAIALLGAILMWKLGTHWYPIALVVTALPCTWLGGRLAGRRT